MTAACYEPRAGRAREDGACYEPSAFNEKGPKPRRRDMVNTPHYLVSLFARRNATRPWLRIGREQAFALAEVQDVYDEFWRRLEAAKADTAAKHLRSAAWQIIVVEYRGTTRLRSWTMQEGQGRYRLLELGIGRQRA